MEVNRKPFQGLFNIVQFNWHFYLFAAIFLAILFVVRTYLSEPYNTLLLIFVLLTLLSIFFSFVISYYIYDFSNLYQLKWLPELNNKQVLNISSGFDETSAIIQTIYPHIHLVIADFYNPDTHTEVSIKRARRIFPPDPQTLSVSCNLLPFQSHEFNYTLLILAAHEIRKEDERVQFFKEINRITKGQVMVTEHLRDVPNFLAYTIGFFHFHSKKTWLRTFNKANLQVVQEIKNNPFMHTFILENNGNSL